MKALSLWQPWASLMADGRKLIETRHWPAPKWLIGQKYAIHAAMKVDRDSCLEFGYDPLIIPRGCIVSIHRLEKCIKFDENAQRDFGDKYGDFEMGRYGWFSPLIEKLVCPIAVVGHQGIWDWAAPADRAQEGKQP